MTADWFRSGALDFLVWDLEHLVGLDLYGGVYRTSSVLSTVNAGAGGFTTSGDVFVDTIPNTHLSQGARPLGGTTRVGLPRRDESRVT